MAKIYIPPPLEMLMIVSFKDVVPGLICYTVRDGIPELCEVLSRCTRDPKAVYDPSVNVLIIHTEEIDFIHSFSLKKLKPKEEMSITLNF